MVKIKKVFFIFSLGMVLALYNNCSNFNGNGVNNGFQVSANDDDDFSSLATVPNKVARLITPREYNTIINSTFALSENPSLTNLPVNTVEIFNYSSKLKESEIDQKLNIKDYSDTAEEVIKFILARKGILNRELDCQQNNRACLDKYFSKIGPKLFRRLLMEGEKDMILDLAMSVSSENGDFYDGVKTLLRYSLMHPSFLFNWEVGQLSEEDNSLKLTNRELLTRISFFILGSGPNLEALSSIPDEPYTNEQLSELIDTMLLDERAQTTADAFHALWLGYQGVGSNERQKNWRIESQALIKRILFEEDRPWKDLFLSKETYINESLAQDYGISHDGSSGFSWHTYENPMRQGLFSHAAFLSINKSGETNVTKRGYHFRKALFCGEIGEPPPEVEIDDGFIPEDPNDCKIEVVKSQALKPGSQCVFCHQQMDTIAFGLENFDNFGIFREHEPERPECSINEEGSLSGLGTFRGPAQLANLAVESGEIQQCLVRRLVEFGFSRRIYNKDKIRFRGLLKRLEEEFESHESYKDLVKAIALSDEFKIKITIEETPNE